MEVKTEGVSKYGVQFIGQWGQLLTEVNEPSASYTVKGHEGYVRAKVIDGAWVQPVPARPPLVCSHRMGSPDHGRWSRRLPGPRTPPSAQADLTNSLVFVRTNLQSV